MAFGQPLLLENVMEVVDPVLDPVLNKEIQRKGRNFKCGRAGIGQEHTVMANMLAHQRLRLPAITPAGAQMFAAERRCHRIVSRGWNMRRMKADRRKRSFCRQAQHQNLSSSAKRRTRARISR